MANTPTLNLPLIDASQNQKHITHNEALGVIDALTQLTVLDRDLTAPPGSPNEGDGYIVASVATGAWIGHENKLAIFYSGNWNIYTPNEGWLVWVADEDALLAWDGSAWIVAGGDTVNPAPLVGVNATADTTNRLSVSSPASLFNHEGDDHQLKVNKNAVGDNASVLFQTNFSGRAEFGLAGDDDFHMKVSPDGSTFHEGIKIDKDDGITSVKGLKNIDTGVTLSSVVFTPGGDGTVSIYRNNTVSSQNPRSAIISSVASNVITLTTFDAPLFIEDIMDGVSYIRIWNMSKAPEESAWVEAKPAGDQLRVTDSADISGWSNGDTIQVGDPTSLISTRVMTLDISPMLINLFGTAFRQSGIMVKANVIGGSTGDSITITPTGVGGSFTGAATFGAADGTTLIPCSDLSPISNSNLVRIRETISTTASIRLVSSVAVLV